VRWDAVFNQSEQVHLYKTQSNYTTTEISLNINLIRIKASTNLDLVATGKSYLFCNHRRGSLSALHFARQLPPTS